MQTSPTSSEVTPLYCGRISKRDFDFSDREQLGAGSYGFVNRMRDLRTGRYVAIKFIQNPYLSPIVNEINIFRGFRHPHLMKAHSLYLSGYNDGVRLDIVMDIGIGLREFISNKDQKWKTIMIYQLLDVLSFLQDNNIIYGDIKIENMLVIEENGRPMLKLTDFSLYYNWECGPVPVLQTYTDLAGYQVRGNKVYDSTLRRESPRLRYNVVAEAMWALGFTILEILVGNIVEGFHEKIPIAVYALHFDTENLLNQTLKKQGNMEWKPLLMRLFGPSESRPQTFSSVLSILPPYPEDGGNYNVSSGSVLKNPRTRNDPPPSFNIDHWLRELANKKGIEANVANLTAEYFLRFLKVWMNIPEYNDDTSLYFRSLCKFSQEYYLDTEGPNVWRSIPTYVVTCLMLSQSLLNSSKEQPYGDLVRHFRDQMFPNLSITDVEEIFSRSLCHLLNLVNGSVLIRLPYYNDAFTAMALEIQKLGMSHPIDSTIDAIKDRKIIESMRSYSTYLELMDQISKPVTPATSTIPRSRSNAMDLETMATPESPGRELNEIFQDIDLNSPLRSLNSETRSPPSWIYSP